LRENRGTSPAVDLDPSELSYLVGVTALRVIAALPFVMACHRTPDAAPSPRSPTPAAPRPSITVRDDSAAFVAFWERAKGEDEAARTARYEAEVVPTFPQYWEYVVATSGGRENAQTLLAKQVAAFSSLEPRYVEAAKRVPADLSTAISALRANVFRAEAR
jgi:hypothetical protein